MQRDQILTAAGESIAYAEDYLETRIHLAKLSVAERGSKTAADLVAFAIIGLFGLFALAAFSVAAAIGLGRALGSIALGFVLTGAFYVLLAALLFFFRKVLLIKPILAALISSLFNPGPDAE